MGKIRADLYANLFLEQGTATVPGPLIPVGERFQVKEMCFVKAAAGAATVSISFDGPGTSGRRVFYRSFGTQPELLVLERALVIPSNVRLRFDAPTIVGVTIEIVVCGFRLSLP